MNFKMMLLADCISPNAQDLTSLLGYIDSLSEICEVRAVAFHDVQASRGQVQSANNLYLAWYMVEARRQN